jgi:glycosyltransferase involved in cell wall biosynthesis
MDKELNIVAYVHGYLPNHNAGAETMLHQILVGLAEYGHKVTVITREPGADEYEGVPIYDANDDRVNKILENSDIIFTHLDFTKKAVRFSRAMKKPLVHLVHNDKQLSYNQIDRNSCQLAIANSAWIAKTVSENIPSVIVYPPTDPKYYTTKTTRQAITLLNMNEAKGGKMFWQLARIFPERQFIGVLGAYGEQVTYDKELPNVTLYKNDPDVKKIYAKTGIVLMPSSYESWGRVGMEAACSGIPCIAAPTPGLKESLAESGVFAEHDDVAGYVEAIRYLDVKENYEKHSKAAKARAKVVTDAFKEQLAILEEKLQTLEFPDPYKRLRR